MKAALTLGLVAVAILMLVEGFRGRLHSTTLRRFFLMDGTLTLRPLVATLAATNFSLGNMIFLSLIWGYFYGLGGMLWLLIGFAIAALVYVRFVRSAPAVRAYIEDHENSGSLHEYLGASYKASGRPATARLLRLLASLVTVLCILIALTLELFLASQLLSPLIGVDISTLFITLTGLICAYSALGGFWAVVKTDILQGALLTLGVVALGVVLWHLDLPIAAYSLAYPATIGGTLSAPRFIGILSILGVTFAWYLVTMDTWQRASAARSADRAAKGMLIGTAALLVGLVVFSLVGMYDALAVAPSLTPELQALHSGGLNPITDIGLLVTTLPSWGQALFGFVIVSLVMAAMSTADTFLVVAGHSFVSDLMLGLARQAKFGDLTEEEDALFTGIARAVIIGMCGRSPRSVRI